MELGAATVAGSFHRHIISNVESQTQTITVYNVEVDEDHTYAAGGFVVHNCPSCWSMHGRVFPVDMPGPADHQQGRCARLPKTRTWRELGFNIDEPADTIVNARTRFASLPDAQQRTIMGPGRLALLRSGRVDWADLSGLRTAEGWRPSYAPRAVHDLERLGMRRAPLTDAQRVAQIAADQHAQLERIMADQSARVQALLGDVHKRFGDLGIPPVPMPRATMPRGPITLTPADASRFADMDVEAIARSRGLDAVPTLAAASDVDAAVQRGWVEAWRGVKRVETNDAFRVGELEFGQGLFGRGYYFTTERGVAEVYRGADVKFGPDYRIQSYSGGVDGGLLRVAINPDARIVDYDALLAERKALLETWRAEGRLTPAAEKLLADRDVSKYASARGYDVIRVRNRTDGVNIDNWPDQYVVLNRQAVLVEGTPELAAARDVARTVAAADDPALKMTVAALKQIAKDNGIQLYAGIKKYDIIHRIRLWESDRLKSGGKILIPDGPIGKPIRFGLAAIDAPPLGIPPTGKPMLTGSALNDWADHFSYDLQYARHEFVDKAGDTAAEGVRVKNLRVALGAYDGSYPDYVVANGTAWRFNGVSYLIEHGPNDFGAPWVSRALTELRAVHEAVPAAVRANKSYTVLQRPSPADVYWRKKFNNPAHTGAMSAGDGHINIYNFQPAISRIETKIDQFRHETGHNLDSLAGRTTAGSQSPAWVAAVDADAVTAARIRDLHPTHYEATKLATVEPGRGYPKGVTDYGRSSAAEDYAESVMLYQLGPIATGRLPGAVTPKLTGVRLPPGATAVTDSEVLYFRDIYPKRATILDKLFPDIAKAQKAEIAALRAGAAPDLSKLTVPQLRELARQRGFQAIATLRKADLVALLNKPPLTPAERAAAERATQRAAARERNRQIEQATGTAKLLAHVDELIAKKADLAVIRQSLIPKLIEPGSLFANADPLILAALRKAADAGDLTKLRAAITRLSTKAKIKPISKAGTTVKFNPDTMEPFAGDIKAGTQVTVVTRGSSVTLPDGTVLQLEKARVQPVPKPVKATPSGIPKPDLTVAPEHLVASVRQALESANFTEIEAYERIKPGMFYRGRGHVDVGFLQGFQHDYPAVWARLVTEARSEWALDRTIEHFGIKGTREQIKARIEANLKKQLASAKVVVRRANESSLRDILERGRMRTQFETKMSGGDYAPTKRARFEEAIWGYARRTDPALRPVYGYMSPLGDESVWPVGQYGGIRIVLKDTVRERTSFAMGDSLGARVGFSPLDSPEWSSYRTFLFTDPTKPVDFWTGDFQKNARYVEAQIHGGVAVDDIAEVIFDGTPSQETIEALKRAGVPWRTAK